MDAQIRGMGNRTRDCERRPQRARSAGGNVRRNRREDFRTRETGRTPLQNAGSGRAASPARFGAIELHLRSRNSLSYLQKAIRPVRACDRNRRMAGSPTRGLCALGCNGGVPNARTVRVGVQWRGRRDSKPSDIWPISRREMCRQKTASRHGSSGDDPCREAGHRARQSTTVHRRGTAVDRRC